jgi:hypothetical protein
VITLREQRLSAIFAPRQGLDDFHLDLSTTDSTRLEQGAACRVADPDPACGEPVESVEREPGQTAPSAPPRRWLSRFKT